MKLLFAILCVTLISGAILSQATDSATQHFVDSNAAATLFENFMIGMMKAIGEGKSLDDLKKCMTDGTVFLAKFKEGLEACRPMTREAIKSGIQQILAATTDLFAMISACLSGYDKLKKLQSNIKSANIDKLVTKALGQLGSFFHLVMNSLEGYMKGDYSEAGKGAGDIFAFLFSGSTFSLEIAEDINDMRELVKGMVTAVERMSDIADLEPCISKSKSTARIIKSIKDGIINAVKFKDENYIVKGMETIFSAFIEIMNLLKDCSSNHRQLLVLADKLDKHNYEPWFDRIKEGKMLKFREHIIHAKLYSKDNYSSMAKEFGYLFLYLFQIKLGINFDFLLTMLSYAFVLLR